MKKRFTLVFALLAVLALLLCACAKDEASKIADPAASSADAAQTAQTSKDDMQSETASQEQIVARVNGEAISYAEFASQMASVEAMYSALTGTLSADEINQKLTEQATTVLESLISQRILTQKTQEYGLTLTAEQEAEIESAWDAMQDRFRQTVSANYPTLEGEDLDAMVLLALENSGIDEQMVVESARSSALIENLREKVDLTLTQPAEEEIRAYYETLLSEQRAEFDNDASAFETAILGSAVVVYIPTEYRVLHVWEFRFEDDVIALLKQLKELDTESSTAYEETLAAEQARTMRTAEMVQALVASGSDFDTLYENANPGKSPRVNYITDGSTRFSKEYYQAAMSISAPGSAAEALIAQDYGYTLLYWAETLTPGEVALDDVKDAISQELLTQARLENWKQTEKTWRSEAEVWIDETLITYG